MGDGFKTGDRVFCSYLNDDDLSRSGYFDIAEINEISITLKTKQGLLLIPMSRVLKVKLQEERYNGKY